jgi:hypothetical protein
MSQNGLDLFTTDARKPLEKVIDARATFEISEERLNRNPRSRKNPRAAKRSGDSFNCRTLAPIKHEKG